MTRWTKRYTRRSSGEADCYGKYVYVDDFEQPEHHANAKYAGDGCTMPNAVEIREHYNYPGGPGFGTVDGKPVKRWPVLTAHVPFPHGREDLRAELTEDLKAVIGAFLERHNLAVEPADE